MTSALKLRHLVFALLVVAGALLFTGRVVAQDDPAQKMPAGLTAASSTVIERLAGLETLPDGEWMTHTGDLAHGEALHLDESSWQPIAVGDKAGKDAVWFRQTYQVPATLNGYDLTGRGSGSRFDANGHVPSGDSLLQRAARGHGRRSGAGGSV